ncbi:MAG: DNA polymerase III subunit gamma/tau [Hahellaceae bacterium]|nr:DNA polymerase III subunit gamma/tau [Hahellaceae bacterium]MCP5212147.1 DNA polymerase III subunit gamma/tau [Hahellaceae bacterium]
MSYQVLARKWRPKSFQEMVGQEHVLKALVHALENKRLHHAYLFTGTRGVGKTTIGRILAKCLNCESGIVAKPCGVCSVCREINEGRFVDLIEIDAASRTKVEDMRELLDNVQYSPTRGRFKVYLIDEVHMLSTSSFNALLKTLEEPPEHVKFLLATTDPQKLPVTILSRCLQFNLKNMAPERIVSHLGHILSQEQVPYDETALWLLARSADGSMRDALSLTDQSIAYGNGQIRELQVSEMLGTVGHKQVLALIEAIGSLDARVLLQSVKHIAEFSPDYESVLAQLISVFHRIAIEQAVPGATDNTMGDKQDIVDLARRFTAEDVQIFYQIALIGRKDLAITPDRQAGFEMVLLRMIAFRPDVQSEDDLKPMQAIDASQNKYLTQSNQVAGEAEKKAEPLQNRSAQNNAPAEQNNAPAKQNNLENRDNIATPGEQTAANATKPVAVAPSVAAETKRSVVENTAKDEITARAEANAPMVNSSTTAARPAIASAPTAHANAQEGGVSKPVAKASTDDFLSPPPDHPAFANDYPEYTDIPESDSDDYDDFASYPAPGKNEGYQKKKSDQVSDSVAPAPNKQETTSKVSVEETPNSPAELATEHSPGNDADTFTEVALDEPSGSVDAANEAAFDWVSRIDELGLTGMTLNIASNCGFFRHEQNIRLSVDEGNYRLLTDQHKTRIVEALQQRLGGLINVEFVSETPSTETPSQRRAKEKELRLQLAVKSIKEDSNVQKMVQLFDATILEKTIEPIG